MSIVHNNHKFKRQKKGTILLWWFGKKSTDWACTNATYFQTSKFEASYLVRARSVIIMVSFLSYSNKVLLVNMVPPHHNDSEHFYFLSHSLSSNSIGDKGAVAIAEAVTITNNPKELL